MGTRGARKFKIAAGATGAGTIGPNGGLTPGDLGTAYGLTTTGGSGQTVAIVDAYNDPNINADLQTFDSQYGLAACSTTNGCLQVVNQAGGTALPANDTSGWSVEETLDVQAVHSVCQGCKILLVEASSANDSDLATAENTAVALGANEVSNSFGEPEAYSSSAFQSAFNHPGVVITASTGDDGYYSFDQLAAINQPDIPASYNTVVAVGGTSLYLGQYGARQSETVWNDNGPQDYWESNLLFPLGAGGGGCSTMFTAQGWQTHLSVWGGTGCGSNRLDADVSAVADYLTGFDIYDSYNCGSPCSPAPGWLTIGGTSLSSPVIAATYALAGGAHGVPYPALTLYGHPGKAYDVTTGGNGWCDGEGAAQCGNPNTLGNGIVDCAYTPSGTIAPGDRACDALTGYDGPTGVGTPKGLTPFTQTGPSATISGPASVVHGASSTWTATATDPFPGGTVTSYTWNWGDGTTTTTTTGSAAHTYTTGGVTRTITLTVTDNYAQTGTATYTVTVS
ncbi:MAG TPA: PKD domain-containing protein [Streptosporangiaceae bacterium]|nr:PKD domain-containing protein [Streptosporangiaceae bacterium]